MKIKVPCKKNYTKSSPSSFLLSNTFNLKSRQLSFTSKVKRSQFSLQKADWMTPCWGKELTRFYIKRCLVNHSVHDKLFFCAREIIMQKLWHVRTKKKQSEIRNYIIYLCIPCRKTLGINNVCYLQSFFSKSFYQK